MSVKTVDERFRDAAKFWGERNKVYGETYRNAAKVMATLFPEGVELKTLEQFQRMQFLEMIVAKLCRYAHNFSYGGHHDSSWDLSIYAMMINFTDDDVERE